MVHQMSKPGSCNWLKGGVQVKNEKWDKKVIQKKTSE